MERRTPATVAAANYLKTLVNLFDGDWHLALASYNGGPGRMQKAIKRVHESTADAVSKAFDAAIHAKREADEAAIASQKKAFDVAMRAKREADEAVARAASRAIDENEEWGQ